MDDRSRSDRGTAEGGAGEGAGGGVPLPQWGPGVLPPGKFDILYDRMCILECRIAALYVYDLWPWMEERGIN